MERTVSDGEEVDRWDALYDGGKQLVVGLFIVVNILNLVAIVDLNGQQALGYTEQVLSLSPLAARWRAFGWDVHEVDGHDVTGLADTVRRLDTSGGLPHVLVARTVFGKGVSYMEGQIKWHYWPMSDDEYRQALAEVDGGQERG